MTQFDWIPAFMGFAIGMVVSALFFAGLAIGMRRALRSANPIYLLTLSAAVRIVVLLGVGWLVMTKGGIWAALGYAIAFFATRFVATTYARVSAPVGEAQ